MDLLQSGGNVQTVAGLQNIGMPTSHSFASIVGSSLSRSTTPDPQLVVRAPSPGLAPIGVRNTVTNGNTNTSSCATNSVPHTVAESDDILAALSRMSLTAGAVNADNPEQSKFQQEINDHQNSLYDLQGGQNYNNQHSLLKKSDPAHYGMSGFPQSAKALYSDSSNRFGGSVALRDSASRPGAQMKLQPTLPSATYLKGQSAPSGANLGGSSPYQNGDGVNGTFNGYGMGGYSPASPLMMEDHFGVANLPPLFDDPTVASTIATLGIDCSSRVLGGGGLPGSNITGHNNLPNLNSFGNHNSTSVFQTPPADPLYIQYLKAAGYAGQIGANYGDSSMERVDSSYLNFLEVQKACLGALLQSQEQYGMPYLAKPASPNLAYYEDPLYGLSATHPGKNRLAAPILPVSPVGPGSPLRHGERTIRFPSGLRNINGGVMGWHTDFGGGMEESFPCSLLEEFKNNKTRCFELSEIVGHVVDFSADQYGSRFIQQKLETATNAEKDMVYEEIMSQALSLMTDVFGNYVVQKFFEHGSAAQIRELANQLNGHVLALSLQMYGCRVIQKAIEVVDLDQKTKMVAELDGHVIRCVRDQNGNHVIQKCIECIPQDAIHFIISTFYDQIVTLSTHPYGCRVVQRILEHCDSPKTQQIVMKEIMQCVCMLAQDQYGNYVIQHVLEHGKPHERSAIIEKLSGQIVHMSQQKFASNVVEKCLTFCGLEERQNLVNEMLGTTDENEPLQAMMKDQFGNYVVQKVLETCDDQQRELILTRIKVHLNALKKYTYGKHIVARVEKLVAAGERRIGLQNPPYPSRSE